VERLLVNGVRQGGLLLQREPHPYTSGMSTNLNPLGKPAENQPAENNTAENDVAVGPYRGCPPPTPEESRQRWAAWHQAMELSHEMLLMGLRQRIGPEGDLQAAYREWYERYQALKWDTKRAT